MVGAVEQHEQALKTSRSRGHRRGDAGISSRRRMNHGDATSRMPGCDAGGTSHSTAPHDVHRLVTRGRGLHRQLPGRCIRAGTRGDARRGGPAGRGSHRRLVDRHEGCALSGHAADTQCLADNSNADNSESGPAETGNRRSGLTRYWHWPTIPASFRSAGRSRASSCNPSAPSCRHGGMHLW